MTWAEKLLAGLAAFFGVTAAVAPRAVVETVTGDRDVLARTIWGEARGEGATGMEAVAAVILNRVADPRWPDTVRGVALQPRQFSAWNEGDPNRAAMLAVTAADPSFRLALDIADRALAGRLIDRTGGANHYHAAGIDPYWTRGAQFMAQLGRHVFWRA